MVLFQEERYKLIADLIHERGRVSVKELSDVFDLSLVTIRKDLKHLEKEGKVLRTHGGAISTDEMASHEAFNLRRVKNAAKKAVIGAAAAALVAEGDIIFLDASTTTVEMCPYLLQKKQLTVLTNSVEIAYFLGKDSECNIAVIGGELKRETLSVIDSSIRQTLSKWQIDIAFFGGWGYSVKDGMSDVPGVLIQQKKIIAAGSKKTVGLMDSTKIGKGSLETFIPANRLDTLVTNKDVPEEFVKSMNSMRTALILA